MIVLLWINKTLRQSFFTVSNYLIITFSVITGVQVIACLWLKYETATMEYWMILTVFIVIALLTDLVASRFAKKVSFNGIKLKSSCESTFMSKHEKRFNIICVFAAMYSVTHFIYLAGGFPKMYYVVQEQFQNQYSAGLNFYIRLFMMIATAYYLGCAKISKKNILLGLLCLIPNILTFVKGIVFIPCLASILLRLKNGDIKISLKAGITIVFVGIMVFFGVYLVEMSVYDPDILLKIDTYQFIGSKLIDYLIAGVQSFSQNISTHNVYSFKHLDNVTLAPFINFMAKFGFGESIDTVNTVWQTFGFSSIRDISITSNVTGSDYANGCYEQSERIARLAMTVVTSIGTVVLPRVANLFQKSNLDEAKRYVYQAFRVVWLLAIPIMFGLMGVSSVFIPLFLGSGFDDAIGLLCIFSILVLVVSLAYVTGISYLIPTKQQNVYTAAVTIAAIVNFCMNLILIPRVGVFGAAIASIVAETIGTAIQIIYCISKKQLNAKQIFVPCWKYLLSGSIMLLFVETLKTKFSGGIVSLCVLICTGGLSYVGVLLILRDRFFIDNINKILKRK